MSEPELPAIWEQALEGDPAGAIRNADERIEKYLNELWERFKDEVPWTDSPPGPE